MQRLISQHQVALRGRRDGRLQSNVRGPPSFRYGHVDLGTPHFLLVNLAARWVDKAFGFAVSPCFYLFLAA